MAKTRFEEDLNGMLAEQRGVYFPVKASLTERLMKKKASPKILHPNPDDEFCFESVGPNYRIISEYEEQIKDALRKGVPIFNDPITVEKTRPKGYLILNGHHRWAAALRLGVKTVPIHIINLAQAADVRDMLKSSANNKRAVFDLDEVLLRSPSDPYTEKAPGFPFNLRFSKTLRLGVPALFFFLKQHGYDIWVYSANFYSYDDVRALFLHYRAQVDGAITGMRKKSQMQKKMGALIAGKYKTTIHIDNDSVLVAKNGPEEYSLSGNPGDWSGEIMDIVKGFGADE